MRAFVKQAARVFLTGAIGGTICASFIFSFGGLIGRSGDTGSEYVGYWSPGYLGLGLFYGSIVGIIFYPVGWLVFLSGFSFQELLLAACKVSIVTIAFGCIGAIHNQILAFFCGVYGFYLGCFIFRNRQA